MEITEVISQVKESINIIKNYLKPDFLEKKLVDINKKINDPQLWNDSKKAGILMKEKGDIENSLKSFNYLKSSFNENIELIEMAKAENDQELINDLTLSMSKLNKICENKKIEMMFSAEADGNDCFLEINAGAGGTDSCDFAEMLVRMYMRFSENHQFHFEIVSQVNGDEAGIRSLTAKIKGHNAYGWLKTESGVHRLVRISPFNAAGKRQTSFASVWLYPVVDDSINIAISDKDLRIDTYRSSGAGGQHVNTTDSAVRITHLPTNTVVQCQNSRSQIKNREEAMKMLKSRLYELELRKKIAEKEKDNSCKTDNSWGNQIRSYVNHPYQMVKDLRTGHEMKNFQKVMDGDIDGFIKASISQSFKQ